MKLWIVAGLVTLVCLGVYRPHHNAGFILDDFYTVVHNPLIKNPSLYRNIWSSRLYDANQSSGYIKFGYYRPVLQSSWILDYRLFGLNAAGYQWLNLFIHAFNCLLVYILCCQIFEQKTLALKACLLFCVFPAQEWVVRYVTGRGDELSALFALVSLLVLLRVFKTGNKNGYVPVFLFWALSALTREVAISYIFYAFLIYHSLNQRNLNRFCFWWVLIGLLPLLLIWSIIPKQGNILALHTLYFASIGFCLWMAQLRFRGVVLLFVFFAAISVVQGRFWTTEKVLLRHIRSLEWWPGTVADQQLLMKYDDDIQGIKGMVDQSQDPLIKAMWLRRLGVVYFEHRDFFSAQVYFNQALIYNPLDVDALDALAVLSHYSQQEAESLKYLDRALKINPAYPDTLRTLGVYYYLQKDFPQARTFLSRCLFFEPDNAQARDLLGLARQAN